MTAPPQNPPNRRPPMGRDERLTVRIPPAMLANFQHAAALRFCGMTDLVRVRLVGIAERLPGPGFPGYLPMPWKAPTYTRPGWNDPATAQLQMRLPRVLLDALDAIAKASGVSRTMIIRWIIAEAVEPLDWPLSLYDVDPDADENP